MEEKVMTINRNSFNSAIPTSVAIIMLLVLYYVFNIPTRGIWGYLLYAILLAGIVWGTIQLRDKHRGRTLTYGQSFTSGMLIGLYTGIIGAIYTFVFYKFFAPEQIQVLLDQTEAEMLKQTPELTDQRIDMVLSLSAKFITPTGLAFSSLFGMLIAGLIISLIVSIFLKRETSVITPVE